MKHTAPLIAPFLVLLFGASLSFATPALAGGGFWCDALGDPDGGAYGNWCGSGGGIDIQGPEITIPDPQPLQFSFSASPTTITEGGSSTLTWSSNTITCDSPDFQVPVGYTFEYEGQSYNFGATSGSVSVSPSSTKTYSLHCSGFTTPSDATLYATVTVQPVPRPDLTAGGISPTTATAGTPVTLSASVSNQGNASASNFPNIIQILGTGSFAVQTLSLSAGNSASVSLSYTAPAPGTFQARACADMNTSGVGSVVESNEDNNCGPWTSITVSAAYSEGYYYTQGTYVPVYSEASYVPPYSEAAYVPIYSQTSYYSQGGYGPVYSQSYYESYYEGLYTPPSNAVITAEPSLVDGSGAGGSTALKWKATDATSCTITSSQGGTLYSGAPGTATTTTAATGITKQTRFTLSCTGVSGNSSASVLVNVIPHVNEF